MEVFVVREILAFEVSVSGGCERSFDGGYGRGLEFGSVLFPE